MANLFQKIAAWVRRYDETHQFTCDVCGREVFENERICAECRKALPRNDGAVCPLCGRRVREEGVCAECKRKPLSVKAARSALLHEGEGARLVLRFKRGERYLRRALADLLEPLLRSAFPQTDVLTFVPMTVRAQRRRGYNQSQLLAEELAARSGLPCTAFAVKRRDTAQQKTLSRRLREENLAGCFFVTQRAAVRGKRVTIVDDTLTTGATVSALASALLRAGAAEVCALTVTSVEDKHPYGTVPPEARKRGTRGKIGRREKKAPDRTERE